MSPDQTSRRLAKPIVEPAVSGGSIARAVSWVWAGNFVSQAAWFGSLVILGALLPPRSFGTVAIGMVIANAAALVQDAGSRGSIIVARQLRRADIARILALNVTIGAILAVGMAVLARPIIRHLASGGDVTVLRVVLLSVAVRAVAIAPMAVLQRRMQFKLKSEIVAASTLIAAIISIFAGALGAGVWALVIRQFAVAALLPLFAWAVAVGPIRSELARGPRPRGQERRRGAPWFFLLAAMDFIGLSLDSVVVGNSRGAAQLGLYSLAFTLAFAPLTNFAWQIGIVLFPAAAAAPDLETIARRMLRSLRLAAIVLLPLLPPTLVLAPVLLPGILGGEWKAMVVPFQILVVVGVGHALTIMIGDSLSGAGEIAFRGRLHLAWCCGMAIALYLFVRVDGIRGAALAHLVLFVPFALTYAISGTRRLGTSARALASALRPVVVPVAGQVALTAGCLAVLGQVGFADSAAAATAAAAGLILVAVLFIRLEPELVRECRRLVGAVVSRGSA